MRSIYGIVTSSTAGQFNICCGLVVWVIYRFLAGKKFGYLDETS